MRSLRLLPLALLLRDAVLQRIRFYVVYMRWISTKQATHPDGENFAELTEMAKACQFNIDKLAPVVRDLDSGYNRALDAVLEQFLIRHRNASVIETSAPVENTAEAEPHEQAIQANVLFMLMAVRVRASWPRIPSEPWQAILGIGTDEDRAVRLMQALLNVLQQWLRESNGLRIPSIPLKFLCGVLQDAALQLSSMTQYLGGALQTQQPEWRQAQWRKLQQHVENLEQTLNPEKPA
jgi:hypothetical protein